MEKLGINWGLLIAQLANLIFVALLLMAFLHRPTLNMLNQQMKCTYMLLGCALVEALFIFALVISLLIAFRIV